MTLEGHVTISRDSADDIRIEIMDARSHVRFVLATLPLTDFARTLMSHGRVPCNIEVRGLERLGMLREWKRLLLPRPPNRDPDREVYIAGMLSELEVDGWRARQEDFDNWHNWGKFEDGSPGVRVLFERWVPGDEKTEEGNESIP